MVPQVRILDYPGEVFGAVRTTFNVCVLVFVEFGKTVTEAWLSLMIASRSDDD